MRFLVVIFLFLSVSSYCQIDSTKKYKSSLIHKNAYQGSRITAFGGLDQFGIQYSPKINQLWTKYRYRSRKGLKWFWLRKMNHYVGIEIQNEGIGGYGVIGLKLFKTLFSINYELVYRYNWNENNGDYSHRFKLDDIRITKWPFLYIGYFVEYNQFDEWRPTNFSLRWFITDAYKTIHPSPLWYRKK